MDHIINAIHSTVPDELWAEILRKIDGPVAADTPADEIEDGDDAEDEYDPVESAQADEDGWTLYRAERRLVLKTTFAPLLTWPALERPGGSDNVPPNPGTKSLQKVNHLNRP